MNNTFRQQLWAAVRIWLLAILLNSIIGTLWFLYSELDIPWMIIFGILFGAIFSTPVLLGIIVVMNILVRRRHTARQICFAVYLTGILLTIFSFILFTRRMYVDDIQLLFIAELAAVLSITIQYRLVKKLGSEFSPAYQFDYEKEK